MVTADVLKISESYSCVSEELKQPFIGRVMKIYQNAALVIIAINAEIDDMAVERDFKEVKVVSFRNMKSINEE